MTSSSRVRSTVRQIIAAKPKIQIQKTALMKAPAADEINPFSCYCSFVKLGEMSECPVHWLMQRMPEGRH